MNTNISSGSVDCILKCNDINQYFNEIVKIYIRGGGKPLELRVQASVIEPQVFINKPFIRFQKAWNGEEVSEEISFRNNSNLSAFIEVDLTQDDYSNFRMELSNKYGEDKSYLIKNLDNSFDDENGEQNSNDNESFNCNDEDNAEDDIKNQINEIAKENNKISNDDSKIKDIRHFEIQIKPKSELDFILFFKPSGEIGEHETEKLHKIKLKFKLVGLGEVEGLETTIEAIEMKCKITLESTVYFDKTFINTNSDHQIISNDKIFKIYSYDYKNPVKYEIDNSSLTHIFKVEPLKGVINPGDDFATLRISFRPENVNKYEEKIIVKLYNQELGFYERVKDVMIYGEGAKPRIYFDKREIILPIVPLGIETKAAIKLRNEGYTQMILDSRFISSMGSISELKSSWVNGNEIGGIKGDELKLEILFQSKQDKPISFTCKLEIFDKNDESFTILVHGVADNCILTNYSFYQIKTLLNDKFVIKEEEPSTTNHHGSLNLLNFESIINKEQNENQNESNSSKDGIEKIANQGYFKKVLV